MDKDKYYNDIKKEYSAMSTEKLIDEFNLQVSNKGWTAARGIHDAIVIDILEARGLNLSAIYDGKTISFRHRIALSEDKTRIELFN